MRNYTGIGLLLLAWTPIGQASLNTAPVSTVVNQQLVAACNLLTTEHADWGNINAMVRSARICLQRPAGQQHSERVPELIDSGLAQRSRNLLSGVSQGK